MERIEELIREIAARHGVAVSRDDPIMILHTLNEQLAKDTEAAQRQLLEGMRSELEEIAFRWGEEAKGKAERILNAALEGASTAMQANLDKQSSQTVAAIESATTRALGALDAKLWEARRFSVLSLAGSLVVVVTATVMFFLAR